MNNGEPHGDALQAEQSDAELKAAWVNRRFLDAPFETARDYLIETAKGSGGFGRAKSLEGLARNFATNEILSCRTDDEALQEDLIDDSERIVQLVSNTYAADNRDIAYKMAVLFRRMAPYAKASDTESRSDMILLASTLVDAVLLSSGPIKPPDECFDPIKTPEDIEAWRQRALLAEGGK